MMINGAVSNAFERGQHGRLCQHSNAISGGMSLRSWVLRGHLDTYRIISADKHVAVCDTCRERARWKRSGWSGKITASLLTNKSRLLSCFCDAVLSLQLYDSARRSLLIVTLALSTACLWKKIIELLDCVVVCGIWCKWRYVPWKYVLLVVRYFLLLSALYCETN